MDADIYGRMLILGLKTRKRASIDDRRKKLLYKIFTLVLGPI
jgi:hypothetical protein